MATVDWDVKQFIGLVFLWFLSAFIWCSFGFPLVSFGIPLAFVWFSFGFPRWRYQCILHVHMLFLQRGTPLTLLLVELAGTNKQRKATLRQNVQVHKARYACTKKKRHAKDSRPTDMGQCFFDKVFQASVTLRSQMRPSYYCTEL